MKYMKLAYGTDEENLNHSGEYNLFEDAFQEALRECDPEVGEMIYVSEIHPYTPRFNARGLLEQINEDAYDKCGEL